MGKSDIRCKTVLESVDRTYNTVSFYQMTHRPPITISDDKHDAQWVCMGRNAPPPPTPGFRVVRGEVTQMFW